MPHTDRINRSYFRRKMVYPHRIHWHRVIHSFFTMPNRPGTLYENFDFDATYHPLVLPNRKYFHAPDVPGKDDKSVDVLIRFVEGPYRNHILIDPKVRERDIDVSMVPSNDSPLGEEVQFVIRRCTSEYAAKLHLQFRNVSALGPINPVRAVDSLLTTGHFDHTKDADWTGSELYRGCQARLNPMPIAGETD